ncbi:hypothetical protein BGZ99_005484 [Dissophora globulifera]|uniref:Guanylate cyclase domain-containing protein n=1 Tax=Dissophora globulifera TaxID=979702 RepID=A0A9P6REY5_9FUNG|nr:hypothetical protein BGZ99_005484 [Dissophora globulifera]
MPEPKDVPSINIAPYMSKFVRNFHADEDRVLETPFNYTQFGAVLMVDIVGFSQMTSIASSQGDVGAEMLSSQIGAYFDIAIRIIEYHGGDVVKFLGDALLVVFQADATSENGSDEPFATTDSSTSGSPTSENPAVRLKRNKIIVRKAVECGLELLARLSNYPIYLSEREFARKLSQPVSDDASCHSNSGISTMNEDPYGRSVNSYQDGNGIAQWYSYTAAVNAGSAATAVNNGHRPSNLGALLTIPVNRITSGTSRDHNIQYGESGNSSRRSSVPSSSGSPGQSSKLPPNYNIDLIHGFRGRHGSAGSHSRHGSAGSLSRPESTSSKRRRATGLLASAKKLFVNANIDDRRLGHHADVLADTAHELQLHLAMSAGPVSNIIIGDIGQENGFDDLVIQTTGRLEYAICGEQMSTIDDALSMARAGELTITECAWKYVNQDAYPWYEPRKNCYILKNIQSPNDAPLLRRVRNDKLFNTSEASIQHYYKYLNKSAIYRLILNPDNNFPAQFRTVTILFVSLGDVKPWTPEGLATCQCAFFQIHKVTSEYEGFIQQFAVDDKGATVLCAFGLPYPRSHEREAVFAAKSAWVIRRRLLANNIRGFKISLATGVIFTGMIGNEFRRDPAIVGDTIVIAVRILKSPYATESVVCDDATKEACTSDHDELCDFEDMGEEFVKGKLHPLRIWRLIHFGAKKQTRRPLDMMVDETIGYEPEREKVAHFIHTWEQAPDHNTILVSGPRGSGKSIFYQQICHIADNNKHIVCSAASAEVEKSTEYYLCKFLLLGLFDMMRKKEIPYKHAPPARDKGMAFRGHDIHQRLQPLQQPLQQSQHESGSALQQIQSGSALPQPLQLLKSSDSYFSPVPAYLGPSGRSNLQPPYTPWELNTPAVGLNGCERTKRTNGYQTRLQSFISLSLQKMGDDTFMAPILVDIILALSSDNSAPVTNPGDDEILADFIVRVLNYASIYVKIILMFEDVQWTDKKSLHIMKVIHEQCPTILIVIFSRPQRDYGMNILQSITGHARHLEIYLEGLKRREIETCILKAFRDKGVIKIGPDVIQLVYDKTKGNPKSVKNMANMLREFCIVNIVEGELLTTGKISIGCPTYKNMEELLLRQDRKKMVLMQYDRMKPRFQEFLKIASCLGDQFSLAEVAAIRPLESLLGTPERGRSFLTLISDLDTFRLLSLATDRLLNMQFSENVVMNTLYCFTSPCTGVYIYESIPYEERVSYHMTMGQFYESFLDPGQTCCLLQLVSQHYLKTDNIEKKVKYLKAVSEYDLKTNILGNVTQNLTELINILDTEPDVMNLVTQEEVAEIYSMKGEALLKRMRIEEAEPALLDSLARYGISWPKTAQQWRVTLFKEKAKFYLLHHKGSTLSLARASATKARVDSKTQLTLRRIIRVLGCLQNVYFWRTEPQAIMLATLYALNYACKLGCPSGELTMSLARYGLLHYYNGNKPKCYEFMAKARQSDDLSDGTVGTEGMLSTMLGYVEYCEGNLEQGHQHLTDAINESKSFGVVNNLAAYYRCVVMKCAMRMWEGAFKMCREDAALLRALSAVAIQNGDYEGEVLFAIPTLAKLLLQDRLRDAESWIVLIERYIMPKARLMNLIVIQAMLSYYYAKVGARSKSMIYAEFLAENIRGQGGAAHPFPLMSCAFTIMSLYALLETSGPMLPGTPSSPNSPIVWNVSGPITAPSSTAPTASELLPPAKVEQILRPVMDCLARDPFATIAQPYLVLADAFRSFAVPGHNREGFQKLLRGWDKVKGRLDRILFVQAYFLSKLGHYAESDEEKDRYYNQAYVLFGEIGMDTTGWLCDPSPGWKHPKVKGEGVKSKRRPALTPRECYLQDAWEDERDYGGEED